MAGEPQPRERRLLVRVLTTAEAILFLFLVVPSPWWDGRLFALLFISSGVLLLLRRNAPVPTGNGAGSSPEGAARARLMLLICGAASIVTGGILLIWFALKAGPRTAL